ncbi:MAG: hypothetical protein WCO56_24585 [Verrucomicrobiota bacterium]
MQTPYLRSSGQRPKAIRSGRFALLIMVALLGAASNTVAAPLPTSESIVAVCVARGEGTWRTVNKNPLPANMSSRELFAYALTLCEGNTKLERLERLFDVAAQMQNREKTAKGYGNFRWSWGHEDVFDFNAVDFCMQSAVIIWIRHQQKLPPAARDKLREILGFAEHGLLRHKVRDSYTNIALMNAGNLILLGEILGNAAAADEGYARLDAVCLNIWEGGIHEYDSPTYYGTDLDDLTIIEAFCQRPRGRAQARALLELFWTDLEMNWFPPAQKLAGARSRDYDYLRGLGSLDQQLMANGWLPVTEKTQIISIHTIYAKWRPPEKLQLLSATQFPRYVRQMFGMEDQQTKSHLLYPDVTLSVAGANYGGKMDLPLTVDFPGPRESVRCYYIPDGRRDPYGKIKIVESKAHSKTLHLNPFFTGAQCRDDAVGLAIYRPQDLPETFETLESHFVMPFEPDGFWIGERHVPLQKGKAVEIPLPPGAALVLRKGTAAVGVRVPWSRSLDGQVSRVSFAYDTNTYGAVRLTVAHHAPARKDNAKLSAAAAFWVRIGSGLQTDAAFKQWQQAFAVAKADVNITAEAVRIQVAGLGGPVAVAVPTPYDKPSLLEPKPTKAVLEVDGDDLGRRLLQDVEPMKSYREQFTSGHMIEINPTTGAHWEAEAGYVVTRMMIAADPAASGGQYVWTPALPWPTAGDKNGSVTWRLNVARAGKYYLWGRVIAPDPNSDSFYVRCLTPTGETLYDSAWSTGTHQQWEWSRVTPDKSREPAVFALPQGEVRLQFRLREVGTKIDRLFLTPNSGDKP